MIKAIFIRKPSSIEELVPQEKVEIEKNIVLTKNLFNCFVHYPLDDYDFIEENKKLMWYEPSKDVMHCIFVTCDEEDYGILIQSEGSSYGRYCAYLPKALLEVKDAKTK
ncbi:MAG: hypothetical protein LKG11_00300 [Bacilli bacterium]|jgi:hypothetical protein|nr:hypothetical protein [Bacilli bacterium]